MSTIASPRETSVNGQRRAPLISTPTSSSRPSLELPNRDASPNPTQQPRRNRAALREYYNLKKSSTPTQPHTPSDIPDDASEASSIHDYSTSDIAPSPLDSPSFDPQTYITHILSTQSLAELLKTYNGVLSDIRALDAEKKALVYDNYSKLIAATETIRNMRANMGRGDSGTKTLDLAVVGIWEKAERLKNDLKSNIPESTKRELEMGKEEREAIERKRRTRQVVREVLESPERVRTLVGEGREAEARRVWERSLRLLERWRERGVGGEDVQACIEDGEAVLRGEPASERSWAMIKTQKS